MDGQSWGLFRTRKEFELAVALEPDYAPRGPYARAAEIAELLSTMDGNRLLQQITEAARGKHLQADP
jgi:hypothetical protein